MKWVGLIGAGTAFAFACYGSASGLERLALIPLARCALWFFDWRR